MVIPQQPPAPVTGPAPIGVFVPGCTNWIVVFAETPVWAVDANPAVDEPIYYAELGQWYQVELVQGDYALAAPEDDPMNPVWFFIAGDPPGIEGAQICS